MTLAEQIAIASAVVAFLGVFFIAVQAFWTRKMVAATTRAYLEGQVLLSVVPRGGTGFLNLRLQNIGAGYVHDVTLSFPSSLQGIEDDKVVDLISAGTVPLTIGDMGPHEKREWHLGFTGHPKWSQFPSKTNYVLLYSTSNLRFWRWLRFWIPKKGRSVKHKGVLDIGSYKGSLLRAYTDIEDLRVEIQELTKAVRELARTE